MNFLLQRTCIVEEQLKTFFDLEEFDFDCRDTEPLAADFDFLLMPNPTSGPLVVKNNSEFPIEGTLRIFDMIGRLVTVLNNLEIEVDATLPVEIESAGLYIVCLENNQTSTCRKLIVH